MKESVLLATPLIKIGKFIGFQADGKMSPKGVFGLRYDVFIKKLKWLPENSSESDHDYYDDFSTILYVSDLDSKIVGTLRIIDNNNEYMMDREFKILIELSPDYVKSSDSAEISRLAIGGVEKKDKVFVVQILFSLLQDWLVKHNKKYFYFVTTNNYANRLKSSYGVEMQSLGKTSFTDDGLAFSAYKVHIPKIMGIKNRIKRYLYINVFRKIFS
jgi:N-acyl-L-homoserine lactone synthetase